MREPAKTIRRDLSLPAVAGAHHRRRFPAQTKITPMKKFIVKPALLVIACHAIAFGVGGSISPLAPILGNYPDTSLPLSTDTTVIPDAAPTNTTSINVSTSTNFKGTLAGNPATGVVRVTDAHPAGTYIVTVT